MASEVGQAYITILPSARGFATNLQREIGTDLARTSQAAGGRAGDAAGQRFGSRFGSKVRGLVGPALGAAFAYGAVSVVKESVKLEAEFSKTMNKVAASTGAPKRQLEDMGQLALKLGGDTVFSANEASEAMLELAKGGLSPAEIQAGSLGDTLTLAAAGGLELGDAANVTVQAMGAFNIEGAKTERIAAALAGAANASAADVSDMAQALSQVGTEANSAGLSVEETTAFLAAFSNAGINGSDAGTSLKTMLSRLVPQSERAEDAMERLGLTFTDANGEFVGGVEMARRLQTAFEDLTPAERSTALSTIFGSDARRAANILIDEGADGIRKYKRETSDLNSAEKMARSAMKGTAGALERLSGATETAQLKIGRGLAPTVRRGANRLAEFLDTAPVEKWARQFGRGAEDVWAEVKPLGKELMATGKDAWPVFVDAAKASRDVLRDLLPLVRGIIKAFNSLPEFVQQALVLGLVAKRLGGPMASGGGWKLPAAAAAAGATAAGAGAGVGAAAGGAGAAAGGAAAAGAAGGLTVAKAVARRVFWPVAGSLYGMSQIDKFANEHLDTPEGLVKTNEQLGDFTKNLDLLEGGLVGAKTGVAGLTDAAFGWLPGTTAMEEARGEIGRLDDQLARMVRSGNVTGARRQWDKLTKGAREQGITLGMLEEHMPRVTEAFRHHTARTRETEEEARGLQHRWQEGLMPATRQLADRFNLTDREARKLDRALRNSTGSAKGHERQLREVADQLGLNKEQTRRLINEYGDVPKRVETDAKFNKGEAERDVGSFVTNLASKLRGIDDEDVKISLAASAKSILDTARGLNIFGNTGGAGTKPPRLSGVGGAGGTAGVRARVRGHNIEESLGATEGIIDTLSSRIGAVLSDQLSDAVQNVGKMGKAGRVLPAGSYSIGMPYLGYPGHYGADYPAATGTPVFALGAGRVAQAQSLTTSYGRHVFLAHPGGVETRYAHMNSLLVGAGQAVVPGQQIGTVGSTGNSTGPHLHFEYRRGGAPVNPANLGIFDKGGVLRPGFTLAYNGTGRNETVRTAEQESARTSNRVQRFVLDIGGGRMLTGFIDDRIHGHASFDATTARMRG